MRCEEQVGNILNIYCKVWRKSSSIRQHAFLANVATVAVPHSTTPSEATSLR